MFLYISLKSKCQITNSFASSTISSDASVYHATSSVTAMLAELGWKRLEDCRKDSRLAILYKIVHGHVAVTVDVLELELPDSKTCKKHNYTYIDIWSSIRTPINIVELPHCQQHRGHIWWQAVPRRTSRDQAPQPICGTLQRTVDYTTRPDQWLTCLTPKTRFKAYLISSWPCNGQEFWGVAVW